MAGATETLAEGPAAKQASEGERRTPFRLLIPAAVLLPLAILAIGAATTWQGTWDQARGEMAHSADAAAEYARSVLELHRMRAARANELLRGLSDEQIRAREPELHRELRRTLGVEGFGQAFRIYVFDRHGRVALNSDFVPSPTGDFTDRDYFQAATAPGSPPVTVGMTLRGRANALLFFPISLRRDETGNGLPPGSFDGLINISVSPETLAVGLGRLAGETTDVLSLVREDGVVLARTRPIATEPPWRQTAYAEAQRRMAAGEPRFDLHGPSALDGISRLVAYRKVDGWPLYVAAARESAAIRARWHSRVVLLLGFGLPAVVGLGLLATLARRALGIAEAARGELELRVRERTSELARRTAELAGSEGRLRVALEAADLGTWEVDCRTRLATRSARASAILGLPAEDVSVETQGWPERVHPEDRPRAEAAYESLRRGLADRYRVEYRLQRPDGSWAWVESCAHAVERDATGEALRIAGTLQDVTARREAEERRALLAREVDHRAKNVLAVVQAALRLTPRHDPAAYAAAVEGRVAALARAHTLLAEHRWAGAELRQLLQGELAAFLPGGTEHGAPRVELAGPPVQIAAPAAQSLSLAFHELATNAVKYGALAAPGGRVAVGWDVDTAAGLLRLRWREAGGPTVHEPPRRRGFGSRVIATTVRDQLGGTLEQRWLPGGLDVEMRIPLARVQAGAVPAVALETVA